MKNSLFGLSENKASAFAYLGFFVTGIIVLLMEKENKTLRFHGLQSVLVLGSMCVLWFVLGGIPFIGWLIRTATVLAWIALTLMAYFGIKFRVPVVGDAAWAYIHKE